LGRQGKSKSGGGAEKVTGKRGRGTRDGIETEQIRNDEALKLLVRISCYFFL